MIYGILDCQNNNTLCILNKLGYNFCIVYTSLKSTLELGLTLKSIKALFYTLGVLFMSTQIIKFYLATLLWENHDLSMLVYNLYGRPYTSHVHTSENEPHTRGYHNLLSRIHSKKFSSLLLIFSLGLITCFPFCHTHVNNCCSVIYLLRRRTLSIFLSLRTHNTKKLYFHVLNCSLEAIFVQLT